MAGVKNVTRYEWYTDEDGNQRYRVVDAPPQKQEPLPPATDTSQGTGSKGTQIEYWTDEEGNQHRTETIRPGGIAISKDTVQTDLVDAVNSSLYTTYNMPVRAFGAKVYREDKVKDFSDFALELSDAGQQVNSPISGNRNETHPLLRMCLRWKDLEYRFAINPEDYQQTEPNRVTVTQTRGGAWVDAWGEGLKEITVKGTTGVYEHKKMYERANADAGYQRWKMLRNMIQKVYSDVSDGSRVEPMEFYNYTDNEYFYCYPAQGGIELLRNKAKPSIYQYTLHLIAYRRIGQPEKERTVIGDPGKNSRQKRLEDAQKELEEIEQAIHNGDKDAWTRLQKFASEHPNTMGNNITTPSYNTEDDDGTDDMIGGDTTISPPDSSGGESGDNPSGGGQGEENPSGGGQGEENPSGGGQSGDNPPDDVSEGSGTPPQYDPNE